MRSQTHRSLLLCLAIASEASDDTRTCAACKYQCNSHCSAHCAQYTYCPAHCENHCNSQCGIPCSRVDRMEEDLETGTEYDIKTEFYEALNPPAPEQFLPVTFSEVEQRKLRIALIFHHSPESKDDVTIFYKDYLFLLRCWAEKHHLTFILDHTPVEVPPFMENVPGDLTRYRGWWGLFFAIRSHLKDYDGVFVMDSDMLVTHPMWGFDPRNLLRWFTEDILISDQCVLMHASMHTCKITPSHAHSLACAHSPSLWDTARHVPLNACLLAARTPARVPTRLPVCLPTCPPARTDGRNFTFLHACTCTEMRAFYHICTVHVCRPDCYGAICNAGMFVRNTPSATDFFFGPLRQVLARFLGSGSTNSTSRDSARMDRCAR